MKDFQTPLKSSDSVNRKSHFKKPQKITKKSLNDLFTSVSNNITPEPLDYSPISEITPVSDSFEIFSPADVIPISKSSTERNADVAEVNFAELDFKSKKVIDALIELVLNEYTSRSGEKERCMEFVSVKICVAVLCFALWILAILVFINGLSTHSYSGPVPT